MLPLVVLLLAAQPALAHDWWYVTSSGGLEDQQAHYSDRASIRRSGSIVHVDEAREGEHVGDQGIIASRMAMEYDCAARTGRIVTYVFLGENGVVLMRGDAGETLHPIERNSVYEQMMQFACGEAEGLEQLGRLGLREQALLLFAERAAWLRAHPEEAR